MLIIHNIYVIALINETNQNSALICSVLPLREAIHSVSLFCYLECVGRERLTLAQLWHLRSVGREHVTWELGFTG